MGTKVLAATEATIKPDFVVSTVAAGAFALLLSEMAIFVGDTAGYKGEEVTGLQSCYDKLREVSNPPLTLDTNFNTAVWEAGAVTLTLNGAIPTLTEDQVAVIYGRTFKAAAMSRTAFTQRLTEKYLETTQKAA
jgi:hypothetical protein